MKFQVTGVMDIMEGLSGAKENNYFLPSDGHQFIQTLAYRYDPGLNRFEPV